MNRIKIASILKSNLSFPIIIVIIVIIILSLQIVFSNQPSLELSKTITTNLIDNEQDLNQISITEFEKRVKKEHRANRKINSTNKGADAKKLSSDTYLARDYTTAPKILGADTKYKKIIPITSTVKAKLSYPLTNLDYDHPVHATILEDLILEDGSTIKLVGAKIMGRAFAFKNKDRLYIEFIELISNDTTYSINAIAMENNKRGLSAVVDNKTPQRIMNKLVETVSTVVDVYTNKSDTQLSTQIESGDVIQITNLETQRVLSVETRQFTLFFDRGVELN